MIGLLGAGLSALGSIAGSALSKKSVDKTNQQNMELARYQNEWQSAENEKAFNRSVEMWNMQNQYNSPLEQMARLKAAGLNPNLVYGNGTVVGNNSGNAPSYDAPRINRASLSPYTGYNLGLDGLASLALQDRLQKASVEKLNAETDTERIRAANIAANTARSSFDLRLAEDLRNTTLEQANANLNRTAAATSVDRQRFINLQAELDKAISSFRLSDAQRAKVEQETRLLIQTHDFRAWENGMKKIGIYPNDVIWARLASVILQHLGIDSFINKHSFIKK